MALYNEVRPQTLSELKGQEDVVKILRKSVAGGTLPNAAILVGTRGTGKTTVARIIAKMVNCEKPAENGDPCCTCPSCIAVKESRSLDVIELDAASNNGVDDVRRIIELVQYKTVSKKKVVILDECHMLSGGAFNALLKVLEEPPKDVLFILCTTEVHKVPATILSRCRRFPFKSLTIQEIVSKLEVIARERNKSADKEALTLVAKAAKGSMRDAETIFESFLELDEITGAVVRKVLGFSSEEQILQILAAVADKQPWIIRDILEDATDRGENLKHLIEEAIEILVSMASIMLDGNVGNTSYGVSELCFKYSLNQVFDLIDALRHTYEANPSNVTVSLLATLVSQACTEDRIAALTRELEEMKSRSFAVCEEPKREVTSPSAGDVPVGEDEWTRIMDMAEYEASCDIPFVTDDPPMPEKTPNPEPSPVTEEPAVEATRQAIGKKALSSLAAAGFVVEEEGNTREEPETSSAPEPVGEKRAADEKRSENAVFTEFESLFHF